MARPRSRHPTELELEILKVLWRDGPVPARHVVDALAGERGLAYTSVVTVMNIMAEKKYIERKKVEGGFVYRPVIREEKTVGGMLRDVVERAFGGSYAAAALNLLERSELDPAEIERIKALLNSKGKE